MIPQKTGLEGNPPIANGFLGRRVQKYSNFVLFSQNHNKGEDVPYGCINNTFSTNLSCRENFMIFFIKLGISQPNRLCSIFPQKMWECASWLHHQPPFQEIQHRRKFHKFPYFTSYIQKSKPTTEISKLWSLLNLDVPPYCEGFQAGKGKSKYA